LVQSCLSADVPRGFDVVYYGHGQYDLSCVRFMGMVEMMGAGVMVTLNQLTLGALLKLSD